MKLAYLSFLYLVFTYTAWAQKATIRTCDQPLICVTEKDSLYSLCVKVIIPAGHCPVTNYTISWGDGKKDEFTQTLDYSKDNEITRMHTYNLSEFTRSCGSGVDYNLELRTDNTCQPPVDMDIFPITFKSSPRAQFSVPDICQENAVRIGNTSCPSRNEMTYQWDFGDGGTSTDIYPTHIFSSSQDAYEVTLRATNSCGTTTTTHTISTRKTPLAQLRLEGVKVMGSDTLVCLENGGILALDGTVSLGSSRYQWQISGGAYTLVSNTLLTSAVLRVQLKDVTSYQFTLVALNDCETSSPRTIRVRTVAKPELTIQHQPSVCTPIRYRIPNPNPNARYFVNGQPLAIGQERALEFSSQPYIVTAELPYACGTYTPKPDTFYVREVRSLKILSPSRDTSLCLGTALLPLTTSETWGNWQGEPGLVSQQSGKTYFNPKMAGTYPYRYVLGEGECRTEVSVTLTVIAAPESAMFTASVREGCTPLNVTFQPRAAQQTGFTSEWSFGNATTSEAYAASTRLENTTTDRQRFLITHSLKNTCGTKRDTLTILVKPLPKAGIGVDSTVIRCAPARFVFSNLTVGNAGVSVWNFGDGTPKHASSEDTVAHVYASRDQLQTYTITLTAKNECGENQATAQVKVSPSTAKPLFSMSESVVCPGVPVQFTDATVPVATRWLWRFGREGTSTEQNPTFIFQQPETTYTITLVAVTPCGTDSTQKRIQTSIRPQASFSVDSLACIGKPVRLLNTSDLTQTQLTGFLWDLGNGTLDSAHVSPQLSYQNSGPKTIKLTVFGTPRSCASRTLQRTIQVREAPTAAFSVGETFCSAVPVKLTNASVGATAYEWYLDGSPVSTGQHPEVSIPSGVHQLTLKASYLSVCSDSTTEATAVPMDSCWVGLPEAFTPDGVGPSTGERITVFGNKLEKVKLFRILNRWGNTVFENKDFTPNDRELGWNGKDSRGNPMPADLYQYELIYSYGNREDEPNRKVGTFYLLRNK
ncbi:PKD domain-containing protein [Siphonobacter curvatus]|nr:PKD domain-containing protein [Siphonobacter curvatus]